MNLEKCKRAVALSAQIEKKRAFIKALEKTPDTIYAYSNTHYNYGTFLGKFDASSIAPIIESEILTLQNELFNLGVLS